MRASFLTQVQGINLRFTYGYLSGIPSGPVFLSPGRFFCVRRKGMLSAGLAEGYKFMMTEALVTYFHYLGFMMLFATLVAQHLLFVTEASPQQIKRLFILDGLYGAAAILVLLTGLAKVFWVGKPAIFYAQNGLFHAKVSLFVLVALLSVWPTVQFIKARRLSLRSPAQTLIPLPGSIRLIQRIELVAVLLLPLLAVFMARA